MGSADGVADRADLVVAKFDNPIANGAMHVIVSRIAVVMLVGGAIGQAELAKQASLNEQSQGAIDGRPTDRMTRIMHVADQFVGIEVLVGIEDLAHQDAPGLGQLLATDLQKLPKFRLGGLGNGKRCQLIGCASVGHASIPQTRPVVVLAASYQGRVVIKNASSFYPSRGRPSSP